MRAVNSPVIVVAGPTASGKSALALKLAEAFGIPAFRATKPEEVDPAIRAAQAYDGPALVWFEIAEEQNVYPMMPAGKGLSDLLEDEHDQPENRS